MIQGRLRVLLLWLSDLACVAAVWATAIWGYRAIGLGYYEYGARFYFRLWPVLLVFTFFNLVLRLYQGDAFHPSAPIPQVEELRRLVASALLSHMGLVAFLAFSRQTTEFYSRAVITLSGIGVAVLAQPARNLVRTLMMRLGWGQIPVLLAGDGHAAPLIRAMLDKNAYVGFRIVSVCSDDLREIVPTARRLGVKILLACQDSREFRCQLEEFVSWFTHIEYLPTASAFPICGAQPVVFDGVGGIEMVNRRHFKIMRLEKNILDKSLSLLAFVCFLPLFVVIPVLIKLTSPGPVFYRAERLGKKGRRIGVWKFRSMYVGADQRLKSILETDPLRKEEWERDFKLVDDPRVTPVGRFLRKTSLDEIPQFFNVLMGDMALIGPRPIVADEIARYGQKYAIFSSVKPGITGLWQCSGRSDENYERRIALDTYYVLNWSPWLDIWILGQTISAVVLMRGAR